MSRQDVGHLDNLRASGYKSNDGAVAVSGSVNTRAIVVTGLILLASSFFLLGGQIPGCLGPLGVTTAECVSRLAPTGYTWAPGPSPGTAGIVGPALVLFVVTLIPWRRLGRAQIVEVAIAAVGAAVLGALSRFARVTTRRVCSPAPPQRRARRLPCQQASKLVRSPA
jgi:hypothetical protein